MKKFQFLALMGAAALTGATLFSCSNDEEVAEVNPTYNPATRTVTADFVFNVATGNTPITRMTSANTQAAITDAFRGIDNASLFSYKLGTPNDGKTIATATTADKTFGLGRILAAGELGPDGSPKSRRVIELSLPVKTNALMFWGKAIKGGTDEQQGKITFSAADKDITNHAFSLVSRIESGSAGETKMRHYQELITTLLNKVVQTKYHADAEDCEWPTSEGGDGTKNATSIDLAWSDFVDVSTSGVMTVKTTAPLNPSLPMCSLGEILGDAFATFNTIYDKEARAGSGAAVAKMMYDLYTVIDKVAEATAASYQEWVAKQVGIEIRESIRLITSNGTSLNAISTLLSNAGLSYSDVTASLDKFPDDIAEINLPKGAAQLTNTIKQAQPVATWAYTDNIRSGLLATTHDVHNYTYPAELCYFGNSPMRVSDATHVTTDYPNGSGTAYGEWMNNTAWTSDWSAIGKHVLSTTRSAAMAHNINYGSSLLKTTVGYADGVTELQDNNATIQYARKGATEENAKFAVDAGLFTLTGVLVGGQPKTVGWNYLSKDNKFTSVVCDRDIASDSIPASGTSDPNYTLVWDNYNSTLADNAQSTVYVALEFTNKTGKDFWGEKNVIRNGGTFYLIGKLDPTATGLAAITWPTDYALPPYNSDGTTKQAKRVFIQDYMTTANFKIGATSLQHAYVTVPDLRSTQISLGLSVDLKWSTGLTFENIILGDI
jgi:hypothetical protein